MKDCNVHHMTTGGVCRDCGTPWSAMTANQHEDAVRVATPPTPDPRERGVNYAAMMAARDENERDAARVADAYLADRGVRWSPGAAQMAADILALEALRAPAPSEAVGLRPIEDAGLAGVGIPRTELTLGVNFASQMAAKHSEGAPDSRVGLPHASPVPAPARGVTVTEAMVERAMGVECGSTHHEHHPPDCRRCWQAKLTAALTPDAEGGA